MIYPYVGDFLISPIPLQLSFNFCSHKCSYCFANLNNSQRSFSLKDFQAQLKSIYSSNSLQSILLRNKYPVLISNLVDPFATSNYSVSVPVIEIMTGIGIPLAIQTRGGRGIDQVLSFLPKSVWYISIPFYNDEIRKKIEPAAPDIKSRIELIDKLRNKGHEVVVGINPTVQEWLPVNDYKQLIDLLKSKGISGIWVAALHFNTRQIKSMPDQDKKRLGITTLNEGLKNARELQAPSYNFIDAIKEYALSNGICVEGMYDGEANNFFGSYYTTYTQAFPTINNFINWCHMNKMDDEPVYYYEFEKVMMKGLITGKHNISPYMRCMSPKLDDEVRSDEGYKQSYKWLLQLCWNDSRMKRQLNRYWTFAQSVKYDNKIMTGHTDTDGHLIFHFNRNTYEEDFLIIN